MKYKVWTYFDKDHMNIKENKIVLFLDGLFIKWFERKYLFKNIEKWLFWWMINFQFVKLNNKQINDFIG